MHHAFHFFGVSWRQFEYQFTDLQGWKVWLARAKRTEPGTWNRLSATAGASSGCATTCAISACLLDLWIGTRLAWEGENTDLSRQETVSHCIGQIRLQIASTTSDRTWKRSASQTGLIYSVFNPLFWFCHSPCYLLLIPAWFLCGWKIQNDSWNSTLLRFY